MIGITLNEQHCDCAENLTLEQLLMDRHLKTANILIELNGEILDRSADLSKMILHDGDSIQIFRITAGG